MILKTDQIAELLQSEAEEDKKDPLVITPEPPLEDLKNSGAASIDLRLGTWFLAMRESRMSVLNVARPEADKLSESHLTRKHYVPFGDDFILHPQRFVLGVTLEWLRMPRNLAGYLVGRSSWGRRGLIIATAAGVHPGFAGCLTLELSNLGQVPIAITPGLHICQLFLHQVRCKSSEIDKSCFAGMRRPTLGKIELDDLTRRLTGAHREVAPPSAS